ncbi:MAG: hypothetical protein RLY86_2148 [Pseudomonadota bacterium]|jgi:hypothetical protein
MIPPVPDDLPTRSIAETGDARLIAAYGYWRSLVPPGADMPPAQVFAPEGLPRGVVPHLALVGGFEPGDRLRIQFVGTVAGMLGGADGTGRYVDEVYPRQMADLIVHICHRIERARRPLIGFYAVGMEGEVLIRTTRLHLPLAGPDGRVGGFAKVFVYEPTDAGRRLRARVLQPGMDVMGMDLAFAGL